MVRKEIHRRGPMPSSGNRSQAQWCFAFFRACSAALLILVCQAASTQRFPTNDEMRQLRGIGSPKISPDGQSIVAEVQDSTSEGGQYHLWLIQADGHGFRQLTGKGSAASDERGASFLPDGKNILFLRSSRPVRMSLDTGTQEDLKIANPLMAGDVELPRRAPESSPASRVGSEAASHRYVGQSRKAVFTP
jgi:Tol biopolymer transport system component